MSAATQTLSKFHTSLNVSNVVASVNFYRLLLGIEPAKQKPDYAKFELDDPPLVLSLVPGRPSGQGALNHVGLRLPNSEELVKVQHRLEMAGIQTKREEGVECCYSRQTKFWVSDPDRTLWELYIFHEDIDEHGDGGVPDPHASTPPKQQEQSQPARKTWQHKIPEPFPNSIPAAENSIHEIEFEGTSNVSRELLAQSAREAFRALRPGGALRGHGLSADAPLQEPLASLPGPASVVTFVPSHEEVLAAFREAGFRNIAFDSISEKVHFTVENVGLREFRITAVKPGHRTQVMPGAAIYLGPFDAVEDDFGNRFRRGRLTPLSVHDWQTLKAKTNGEFVFLESLSPKEACCS